VLELAKTKLGEADGSTGVQAHVNAHIGKLLLGAGISALLNIGVQSAAGTPGTGQFYANPAQQAGRDAAQQLNADAKRIVEQNLRVPPTLTQAAGHEVSLHLAQNINLGKAPVRVP
jgi:type IV secretory pathway VirB10-like protein